MSKIAIISDTDCSIPLDLSARLGILQVPILVQFGETAFEAAFELNDLQAFERIDRENQIPTTSAPSPGAFSNAYARAFEHGAEAAICFCVSGEVSATYGAALAGRDMHPDKDITVVDTRSLTMAQGFAVLAATEAAAGGASKDEIIAKAKSVIDRSHLFAALSTLKYLALSGRVGTLAAGMAGLLNIMPILTIRDGKLDMLEKTRARSKAWNRVFELTREAAGPNGIEHMAILNVAAPDAAQAFEEKLRAAVDCPAEILHTELTPGMSVHAGAGLVGVAFVNR